MEKEIISKIFNNETSLNDFVLNNNVDIISIETTKEKYDTGLPMMRGGSFKTERTVLKLWYKSNNSVLNIS